MVRQINRLTTRQVDAIKSTGRHADGQNLFLSVSENGGRRWVFLYRWKKGGGSNLAWALPATWA